MTVGHLINDLWSFVKKREAGYLAVVMRPGKRAIDEAQKTERRDEILEQAFALFAKASYEQLSMDQVARRVRLAKGTLYLYFRSKEELFFALKAREYERWFDALDSELQAAPAVRSVAARIDWLADMLCKSVAQREPMLRLVVSLHHVLERNLDPEFTLVINRNIARRIQRSGTGIERFLALASGRGARLLLWVKAAVIGLYYAADRAPVVRAAEEPGLDLFALDWLEELNPLLLAVLRSVTADEAKRSG